MTDKTTDITGATEAAAGGSKRISAKRDLAIVQRLLQGESLETVSRDENAELCPKVRDGVGQAVT